MNTDPSRSATSDDMNQTKWRPVAPVAGRTPRINTTHPEFGRPVSRKVFQDGSGAYMASFKFRVGDAFAFDGISLWQGPDGRLAWRWAVLPRGIAPPEIDAQIDRLREAMTRNPQPAELAALLATKTPEADLCGSILAIFKELDAARLSSKTICRVLSDSHDIVLTPRNLATRLLPRNIKPKKLRIGGPQSVRGYERSSFESC